MWGAKFLSLFSRRNERQLIAALRDQLEATREGAQLVRQVVRKKVKLKAAHRQMEAIEHKGDRCRGELIELLSQSLASPIDREDMFRLSRSIDDVLDTLRDFVRESDLYRVGDQSRLKPAVDDIVEGIENLDDAVEAMGSSSSETVRSSALAARKAGGAACRKFQYEMAHLLKDDMSTRVMKAGELARRLDIAGGNICEAADVISDGVMKRWR